MPCVMYFSMILISFLVQNMPLLTTLSVLTRTRQSGILIQIGVPAPKRLFNSIKRREK